MARDVLRTCLACGRKQVKKDLLRLVADDVAVLVVDHGQRFPGRGAYCCNNRLCLRKLCKGRKKVSRALRREDLIWNEELKAFSGVNNE